MAEMFCFQCQQTAGGSGCVRTGVCGKQPETAQLQDALLDKLVRLAQACERKGWRPDEVTELLTDGLFITLTNVNFDDGAIRAFTQRIDEMLAWVDAPKPEKDPGWLWRGETDLVSLRSTLLFGLKGMAAYAHHARELGYTDSAVDTWFYKGLTSLAQPHSVEEWLALILEFGRVNFQCMALLDQAHTETFGHPVPTRVNTDIQKGPFIVVTGHDLKDLRQLLKQTAGKGVNVYTHGEMLPAHGYPELKNTPIWWATSARLSRTSKRSLQTCPLRSCLRPTASCRPAPATPTVSIRPPSWATRAFPISRRTKTGIRILRPSSNRPFPWVVMRPTRAGAG